jgi:hypothetical protein
MAVGRQDYEERKERKIAAYENRAAKAGEEAGALFEKAHKMAEVIPFGQPILVGHHSEGRHRAHIKRIEGAHHKAAESAEKAAYYQGKAETASKNEAISGDNPEAVKLYVEKLTKLEAAQERMKAVNKAFANGDEALKALGLTDEQIAKMKNGMPSYEKKPYPTWALTNNSAEIRRVREKIEALNRLDKMIVLEKITFPGGELVENLEINRVQFIFEGKPSEEIRATLKAHGFHWAPSEGAWQRQRTAQAIWAARGLADEFKANGGKVSENE